MSATADSISSSKDRIVEDATAAARQGAADIKRIVTDIEDLLTRIAKLDDPKLAGLRARLESALATARTSTLQAAGRVRKSAVSAAGSADDYARDRPWTVAGIAAIAGLALGAALLRR